MSSTVQSGIPSTPQLKWGNHLTHFFKSGEDLRDLLVPYFKAGLESNEYCLWGAGAEFGVEDARAAMRAVMSDFDARERKGQITILDARDFYGANGTLRPYEILGNLVKLEQAARENGYEGLRGSGNCAWIDAGQWVDFQRYEALLQRNSRGHRMICICHYCLDQLEEGRDLELAERHDIVIPSRSSALRTRNL